MKTKEELEALRRKAEELQAELSTLTPSEMRDFLGGFDEKSEIVSLSPEELDRITGGDEWEDQPDDGIIFIPVTLAVNANVAANVNEAINANTNTNANLNVVANTNALYNANANSNVNVNYG